MSVEKKKWCLLCNLTARVQAYECFLQRTGNRPLLGPKVTQLSDCKVNWEPGFSR
jgi:hypothetical protein